MASVPGETTGWYLVTVSRFSIFFDDPPEILEYDWGQFDGVDVKQAMELARLAREVQSLDYKVGPALVCDASSEPSLSTMLRLPVPRKALGCPTPPRPDAGPEDVPGRDAPA